MTITRERDPIWIRWIVLADLPEMAALDALVHPCPWDVAQLRQEMARPSVIAKVADLGEGRPADLAGMMVYRLAAITPPEIELLRFAVHPDWRRHGIGAQMLLRLLAKVQPRSRWRSLRAVVPETCVEMQIFLREFGFRAVASLRSHWGDEDGIEFVWQPEPDCRGR